MVINIIRQAADNERDNYANDVAKTAGWWELGDRLQIVGKYLQPYYIDT